MLSFSINVCSISRKHLFLSSFFRLRCINKAISAISSTPRELYLASESPGLCKKKRRALQMLSRGLTLHFKDDKKSGVPSCPGRTPCLLMIDLTDNDKLSTLHNHHLSPSDRREFKTDSDLVRIYANKPNQPAWPINDVWIKIRLLIFLLMGEKSCWHMLSLSIH